VLTPTTEFRIVHGTKSEFQLNIDPTARVLEVIGANVKRWDLQKISVGEGMPTCNDIVLYACL